MSRKDKSNLPNKTQTDLDLMRKAVSQIKWEEDAKAARQAAFLSGHAFMTIRDHILKTGEPLSSEDFAYFPSETRQKLELPAIITDDDIRLFLDTASDDMLPADEISSDDANPFFNFTIRRGRLACSLMSGQGTLIVAYPVAEDTATDGDMVATTK